MRQGAGLQRASNRLEGKRHDRRREDGKRNARRAVLAADRIAADDHDEVDSSDKTREPDNHGDAHPSLVRVVAGAPRSHTRSVRPAACSRNGRTRISQVGLAAHLPVRNLLMSHLWSAARTLPQTCRADVSWHHSRHVRGGQPPRSEMSATIAIPPSRPSIRPRRRPPHAPSTSRRCTAAATPQCRLSSTSRCR